MPIDPERNPQVMPQQKLRGLSVPNFLATIRAAAPEQAGITDDALFHKFITEYPDEPQIRNLSGLSIGQMATIVRANAPDTGNVSDFQLVQDFLKQYPQENTRLSGAERAKLGLVKVADVLPIAGAIVGGLPAVTAAPGTAGMSLAAASGLSGLGAGAGTAAKQLIRRAVGADVPESSAEAAEEIGLEGISNFIANMVGGKLLKGVSESKLIKTTGAQAMKWLEGIGEHNALKAISDPEIMLRAKSMPEAEQLFGNFFENLGYKYGPKSVKAAVGKRRLSDEAADDFISEIMDKIEEGTFTGAKEEVQQALAARYGVRDAISRAAAKGKAGRNDLRDFVSGRKTIDDWLEKQIPGFADTRKMYEEAMIKDAFSSIFPLNKNGQVSVLRTIANAYGVAQASTLGPAGFIAALTASSPYAMGKALTGAALVKRAPIPFRASGAATATELTKQAARRRKKKEPEAE